MKSYKPINNIHGVEWEFYDRLGKFVCFFHYSGWGSNEKSRMDAEVYKEKHRDHEMRVVRF